MEQRRGAKSYNRYFDGFSEREVVTPNGGLKIEHVYTGDYYRENVPEELWKRRKIAVGFLYAIAVLLFLVCGVINCEANSCWYVILFYGITFVSVLLVTMNVFTKVTAKRDMIARVFRSAAEQYEKRMRFTAVTMFLTAGAVLVNLLINMVTGEVTGFICFAGYVFSGMTMYRLYRLEEQNQYQRVKNTTKLDDPDEFVEITY
ncbi:MAG: hypothetical protein LUG45_02885 [Clostridiales bacterium]|nr:hypothetical protein [Clostridiales bacterium]